MYDTYTVEEFDQQEGYTLKVVLDPEPFHPFEDDDGKIVTFVFEHRRYDLGDYTREGFAAEYPDLMVDDEDFHIINRNHPDILAYEQVEMLDHSGLRFYLQRERLAGTIHVPYHGWDSGVIGVALVTRQDFERVGLDPDAPDARQRAQQEVRSAVSILDQYHSGQVYGYQIEDKDGDIVDDLYGIYAGLDSTGQQEAEQEGKASLERLIESHVVKS
jgi:hypothetical protein